MGKKCEKPTTKKWLKRGVTEYSILIKDVCYLNTLKNSTFGIFVCFKKHTSYFLFYYINSSLTFFYEILKTSQTTPCFACALQVRNCTKMTFDPSMILYQQRNVISHGDFKYLWELVLFVYSQCLRGKDKARGTFWSAVAEFTKNKVQ